MTGRLIDDFHHLTRQPTHPTCFGAVLLCVRAAMLLLLLLLLLALLFVVGVVVVVLLLLLLLVLLLLLLILLLVLLLALLLLLLQRNYNTTCTPCCSCLRLQIGDRFFERRLKTLLLIVIVSCVVVWGCAALCWYVRRCFPSVVTITTAQ